ncbi:GH32 C-terminal domain-containing protein [Dongshaea marina]|uniref:GH32 C-terminal domain-containing protein n=1 Tax=Dongshaea marina TaxID=2047966 RepID=UPI00389903C1
MVRELKVEEGRLYQQPVSESRQLRRQAWCGLANPGDRFAVSSAELLVKLRGELELEVEGALRIRCTDNRLILERNDWQEGWQQRLWQGRVRQLQIFVDHSTLEIFINQGRQS